MSCLECLPFSLMGIAGVTSMVAIYRFGKKTEEKIEDLDRSLTPREMEEVFKVMEPPISILEWSTTSFSVFSGFFSIISFFILFSDYLLILFGVPMVFSSALSMISLYRSVYRPDEETLPKTLRLISTVYPIVGLISLVYAFHVGGVLL